MKTELEKCFSSNYFSEDLSRYASEPPDEVFDVHATEAAAGVQLDAQAPGPAKMTILQGSTLHALDIKAAAPANHASSVNKAGANSKTARTDELECAAGSNSSKLESRKGSKECILGGGNCHQKRVWEASLGYNKAFKGPERSQLREKLSKLAAASHISSTPRHVPHHNLPPAYDCSGASSECESNPKPWLLAT
jgi:hypothetical protein